MPNLILIVGPPGSGKTAFAKKYLAENNHSPIWINQDSQGKERHFSLFKEGLSEGVDVVVDRMNFSKEQRDRYFIPAKIAGYTTTIIVLHESYDTCLSRCLLREQHETIKEEKDAVKALNFFFTKYERVQDDEADEVLRLWPEGVKDRAVIFDIDGTMANIDHRLHHVKGDKKDWKSFFQAAKDDTPNDWCRQLFWNTIEHMPAVYCSGRPDDYRNFTEDWLFKHCIEAPVYMRRRGDFRPDHVVKEVILDFEILTRHEPLFFVDDRKQVVDMWRRRGYTCLQCAPGEF